MKAHIKKYKGVREEFLLLTTETAYDIDVATAIVGYPPVQDGVSLGSMVAISMEWFRKRTG